MSHNVHGISLPSGRRDMLSCTLAVGACCIAIFGWQLLWFLTDDAFISFRYVSNWVSGIGPTWNPPPFQPVEGYSNFSWVALLSLAWKITGLEPPEIANLISLMFGLGTLLLTVRWLWHILLSSKMLGSQIQQFAIFSIALLLVCTNKNYLTWLSSGLETSLSTFIWVWWAYVVSSSTWRNKPAALWQAALSASLLALTRPDGLLVWGLTVGWLLYEILLRGGRGKNIRNISIAACIFISITIFHLLWRHSYYHDFLPNTYYAKVGAAWPEMGLAYLLSYLIEYALYIPLSALLFGGLYILLMRRKINIPIGVLTVIAALCIQAAYYGLIVGGDHFEYRVLHHFVPLTVIAVCSFLTQANVNKLLVLIVLLVWLVLQSVIPWQHWVLSKDLNTRAQTLRMIVPVADSVPKILQPLTAKWDELQALMINHSVCMRHQEHKIFYLWFRAIFPSRQDGLKMQWADRNIIALGSVGVPGWVYPNAAIIDTLGLNDRVLAKTEPKIIFGERQMAHSVNASNKYASCYKPNFEWVKDDAVEIMAGKYLKAKVSAQDSEHSFDITPAFKVRGVSSLDSGIISCETRHWDSTELYAPAFSGK